MRCGLDALQFRSCISLFQNMKENPIHIINVSIKQADTEDDDALVSAFTTFAQSKVRYRNTMLLHFYLRVVFSNIVLFVLQRNLLHEYGIRRITFLIAQKVNANIDNCVWPF